MLKKLILNIIKFFYKGRLKRIPFNVFSYLIVGGGNTALNIVLFSLLYFGLADGRYGLEIATGIAFISTSLTGFWLNKTFAFSDSSKLRKAVFSQFGKYVLVSFLGQLFDYFITKSLILFFEFDAVVAYMMATAIVVTSTYFMQRYFTFKKLDDQQIILNAENKSMSAYKAADSQLNSRPAQ